MKPATQSHLALRLASGTVAFCHRLPATVPCPLCLARITLPACRRCNGSGRVALESKAAARKAKRGQS